MKLAIVHWKISFKSKGRGGDIFTPSTLKIPSSSNNNEIMENIIKKSNNVVFIRWNCIIDWNPRKQWIQLVKNDYFSSVIEKYFLIKSWINLVIILCEYLSINQLTLEGMITQ